MHEPEHLVEILEETKNAIEQEDVQKLKELSNQTIHTASIEKDTDSVTIAVIVYSLGKIIERGYNRKFDNCDNFCPEITNLFQKAIESIKSKNNNNFSLILSKIIETIKKLSGNLKDYVDDVFEKAKINKASKIYEHGISMEQTAKLLGITQWDLASYLGQNQKISDLPFGKTIDQKTRIKYVLDLFKEKKNE